MQRRQFFQAAAGTFAAGAFAGCSGSPPRDGSPSSTAPLDAERFHAERRSLVTSFGHVAYLERGQGPAALFLHGFPLNGFQWRGAIERLSSLRRCITADFLGLGYTQVRDGASCAPAAQVSMLGEVLDSLGIADVDLIANDSGGAVAQLFMLRFPQRVRTVLLTNCDVEPDSPPPALQPVLQLAREGKFADAWLAPWVADKTLARSREGLGGLTYTFPDQLSDEAIDYYLAPLVASPRRKVQLHAYALGLDPNPLAGIESQLRQCRIPTRIVWGTGDDIFSPASPDYLDALLPNSRGVRRIEGAKLFFPEEFPDVIAEEAQALWRTA